MLTVGLKVLLLLSLPGDCAPNVAKVKKIVRQVLNPQFDDNWKRSFKENSESPLILVNRIWNADSLSHSWISYDRFGNPWILKNTTPKTSKWTSLNSKERIQLVMDLAMILAANEDAHRGINFEVPLFKETREKAEVLPNLRNWAEVVAPEDLLGFDPHHFLYLAVEHRLIRGSLVRTRSETQGSYLWDPLPYALGAILLELGVPAEDLRVRSGRPSKKLPEKFWLEVKIDDSLPILKIAPSLIHEMTARDQNSSFKKNTRGDWYIEQLGFLDSFAKNKARQNRNRKDSFFSRPLQQEPRLEESESLELSPPREGVNP